MLNKIIDLSLNNRLVVLVLSGLLLLAGVTVLLRTEVDIFPDLNAPTVVVMTEAPGFAPEEVEKIITFPIETAVNGATGVRRVRSSSAAGFSVVWVEFDWGTDIYRARQTVSEKLSEIEGSLPPGIGSPTLGPQSSILGEVLIIGLTADSTTTLGELRTIADRRIRPRLLSIGGVSQVSVIGGDIKEYQILVSPERMKRHDISLGEVMDAVATLNSNASGGVLYEYGNEYLIKGDIATTDVDELAESVIRSDERGMVKLGDIADVTTGHKEPRLGVASVDAQPAVLLTVTKQPAVGTIDLTKKIEDDLTQMAPSLPADVTV
ncbi:MAG: efflux RND transporter permease subunit, partial [Duncaniella sp.]|nr:efflux RND transporter permease subunit [Duncaniella sp.]